MKNFNMMVAILNLVCVASCAQQNGSFHVKSNLYQLGMGCKKFYLEAVISAQSFKKNWPSKCIIFSTMHRSNFLSTCIPNAVANYLLFQYQWSFCLRSITTPWQDWCMWVLRSAGELVREIGLTGCALWKLTKIGTKYSMHKIAHVKQWELWTSSSEVYIAYWTMNNRQTGYKVRYLCWSRPEWQWPVMLSTELQCVCVLCTIEIFFRTADRQDQRSC